MFWLGAGWAWSSAPVRAPLPWPPLIRINLRRVLRSRAAGVNQSVKWFVDNYATARKGH